HARPETFGATTLMLVVASPLTDVTREQHEVQEAMFVGIPIALLLAGVGGLWLASIGLRPITVMARRAAQIPLTGMEDLGAPARRLGTLGEDVLVLARADAGGYPLRPVDLYLDEVVDECRRAVEVLAADRGITVRATGASSVAARGDEELLRRLIVNLLQN